MKKAASLFIAVLLTIGIQAQEMGHSHEGGEGHGVPAHHTAPPGKAAKLPAILTEKEMVGPEFSHPAVKASYKAARAVPDVLHQLPCYCFCDRNFGHKSLRTCFESNHGARCGTCMQEALLAHKMTKQGKTPSQIRAAVNRGDYKTIDLQSYTPAMVK
jgi:hypothetical protein